ncbi:MAG: 4Fe-4S dicluster domain-containing protein [Thermoplasmata archaeon]
MPTYVNPKLCKNNAKCMEICPSDIMFINKLTNFSFNQEPDMCWECFSCVKICPEHAISMRPYADISPYLSEISVVRDEKTNRIQWEVKYRDQQTVKHFDFRIRTTPWDSIQVPAGPDLSDPTVASELLSGESAEDLGHRTQDGPKHPAEVQGVKRPA